MKNVINNGKLTFTFDGLEPLTFDPERASAANRAYAELFGWQPRLKDMAAISRVRKDSAGVEHVITITEQMRRDAVEAGINHYYSGTDNWSMKGPGKVAPQNRTILALAAKLGKTYEETEAILADDDVAELLAS